MTTVDVVGIGALNVDFIVPASAGVKIDSAGGDQYMGLAEFGTEQSVDEDQLTRVLQRLEPALLQAEPGGSAFNVIHALARLDLGLALGMVGVAGQSSAREVDFKRLFTQFSIDDQFVTYSPEPSGRCVSIIEGGERTLLTAPGANRGIVDTITNCYDELVSYLAATRLIHVTSLFHPSAPETLARLLSDVKDQNPLTLISFDPGHTWAKVRHDRLPAADAIDQLLALTSFLFLNYREFGLLGDKELGETDEDVAQRLFELCSDACELILLKKYDGVELYRSEDGSFSSDHVSRTPLDTPVIEDATGAGDVFAAGVLAAAVSPRLQGPLGVAIGMGLARSKLQYVGTSGHGRFADATRDLVSRSLSRAADDRNIETVVFLDMAGSTEAARTRGDREHTERTSLFKSLGKDAAIRHYGTVDKEIGDELMVVFETPGHAIEFAQETARLAKAEAMRVRVGIHTGPIRREADSAEIAGLAVNIAARIASEASAGEIMISRCTRDLVNDGTYNLVFVRSVVPKGLNESFDLWVVK